MSQHSHTKRSHVFDFLKRRDVLYVSAILAATFLFWIFSSGISPNTASASPEVKFTDASNGGMQIVPASCPSTPDYPGQCDTPPAPQAYACGLSASNYTINQGDSTTLYWSWYGYAAWYPWYGSGSISPDVGGVGPAGATTVSPSVTTDYVYTTNGTFATRCDATITVIPTPSCSNGLDINSYPSCTCPSGQTQSGNSCVAASCSNGLNINSYPSCTCPSGQVQSGSACVTPSCQTGYTFESGQCVFTGCPTNYTLESGQCVLTSCPTDYTLESGQCVLTSCPTDYTLESGQCVLTSCPSGYALQDGQCIQQCTAHYYCSGSDLRYVDTSCADTLSSSCTYGCTGGACMAPPAPSATLTAVPSLVQSGFTSTISWSATNVEASSCTVHGSNGDSWSGNSGTQTSSAIFGQVIYTLSCTGTDSSQYEKQVTVNIVPKFNEN